MIDPRAIIDPGAELADDVEVGPFTLIGRNVKVESGTRIGSHSVIEGNTTIGKNNRIHHHVVLGAPPQDLRYAGEQTSLVIGDKNVIREFSTVHRGTPHGGTQTRLGNQCMLMAYVHIAHDCQIGNEVILANAVNMAGHVTVQDYANIGGMVAIHQFVRIGRYAFIGGSTPISQDVLPFSLVAGVRGELKGVNAVGLKRRGFDSESRTRIRNVVRTLIKRRKTVSQIVDELRADSEGKPEYQELIAFISESKRGINL
jgi:UDP-N-acetylglucosamine acyltransferase